MVHHLHKPTSCIVGNREKVTAGSNAAPQLGWPFRLPLPLAFFTAVFFCSAKDFSLGIAA